MCIRDRYKGLIADIKRDNNITEIQSAQFIRLREKIPVFTEEDELTVVYPIPRIKKIIRIDTKSGKISKPRVSPKKGTVYDIFTELYGIRDLLCNPRLHFRAVLLDITEYRYISEIKGSRKKVRRADRKMCIRDRFLKCVLRMMLRKFVRTLSVFRQRKRL